MKRVGFVFQKPVLLQRTVAANITFALNITGTGGGHENDIVRAVLENAGLLHLSSRHARSLSGGEQQRVALARSIACSPELLILDEPTINLDPASMAAIEARLASARAAGTPILMITHDLAQARRLADTVVFMHRGRVCEIAAKDEFFAAPCSREAEAFLRGEIVL
jgi:tungstate transport system ATP-binding protein